MGGPASCYAPTSRDLGREPIPVMVGATSRIWSAFDGRRSTEAEEEEPDNDQCDPTALIWNDSLAEDCNG